MEKSEGANWFKCVYQFHPGYCAESLDQIKPWIKGEVMPLAANKMLQSRNYRILAVGSGTGIVDQYLLQLISDELRSKTGTKVLYTVVEADAEAVDVCKTNLSAIKNLDIEFAWEVRTINDFLNGEPGQYDMIHFMYSLFVLDNPLTNITDLLRRGHLVDDGILFTMYHDEKQNFFSDVMFNNMDSIMKIYEGGEDFDGFKTDEFGDDFHKFNSNALEETVAKYGWKCKVISKVNKDFVTDIVQRTDEGTEKLGYILGCRNIKEKLAREELDKIIDQIDKTSKKEMVDGAEIRFGESMHCLIIMQK